MRRSSQWAWVLSLAVGFLPLAAGSLAADEFVPPPQAEREAVAAISMQGGRVQVDGEYRITTVMLGANSTNDDLKFLAACERLTTLQVASPKVTDAAIEHLKGLSRLTSMFISSSGMTTEGLAALRAALPNCRITSFGGRGGVGGPGGGPGGRGGFGFDPTMLGPPGFGGRTSRTTLARNTAVQDDLKLTTEQRQQITVAAETTSAAAITRAADEKITATLTPEQIARLKQIELQQLGTLGLLREDTAKELKLADEQKTSIGKLRDDAVASLRTAMNELRAQQALLGGLSANETAKLREKLAEVNKTRDEKILAVLNEEQRKSWEAMLGPKGPVVSGFSDSSFGSFNPQLSPAEAAKSVFNRYDTDNSGTLTDAEFPDSNRTRRSITTSGVMLKFPMAREEFEKMYAKYLEGTRAGR